MRRRRRHDSDELLQDPVLLAERERISRGGVEAAEPDDDVGPIVVGGERRLDLGDDSVGAVGVHRLVQVLAGKFERPRRRFHRHQPKAQHVAEIAQASPVDRAYAARTSGDEAGDGRGAAGRGKHAQFLPGSLCRLVDVDEDRAGLADDAAALDRLDLVHLGQVEENAAGQRHRLAVVAGPRPARGDWNSRAGRRRRGRSATSASVVGETTTSAVTASSSRLSTGEYQ